jgi:hypothetical protein
MLLRALLSLPCVVLAALSGACATFHQEEVGDAADVPPLVLPRHDATTSDARDASREASPKDAGPDSPFAVVQGVPQGQSLFAVWGSAPDDIFAVGSDGLHCDYYSAAWHCMSDVAGRDYYGVWGTEEDDVYAVGTVGTDGGMTGIVEHFDGTGWTDAFLAPTPLLAVWGVGDQVLAVGPGGNIYGTSPGMDNAWGSLGVLPPTRP